MNVPDIQVSKHIQQITFNISIRYFNTSLKDEIINDIFIRCDIYTV